MPNFLDLFAGAGGLSEGFIQAGYTPISHVEMDEAACNTLKTRAAYHWLKNHDRLNIYENYLDRRITRQEFYASVPKRVMDSVINCEITEDSLPGIFEKIDKSLKERRLDLIVGGPPCQAYSLVGRARDENGMVGDKRNYLYRLYARFLERYTPRFFVFENVTGLLSAKDSDGSLHFDNMKQLFSQCGYSVEYKVLNAFDYGVLQQRKRIILIGKRGAQESGFYPEIQKTVFPETTVSEVFKDLPRLQAGEGQYEPVKTKYYRGKYLREVAIKDCDKVSFHIARPHTEQDLEIYRIAVRQWENEGKRIAYTELPNRLKSHKNMSAFLDRFKVVAGDLPYSQTVVAHIARDGHYYIHPDIEQNRSLTPREAARLQTFPDSYYFESKKDEPGRTAAYRQIGNAVPVRLAYSVANALLPEFRNLN